MSVCLVLSLPGARSHRSLTEVFLAAQNIQRQQKQVVSPEQFLAEGSGLRLNGKYYITKVINPALDRALALVGVDVNAWYNDMPRPAARVMPKARASAARGRGGEASGDAPWWNDASADRRRKKGKAACVITNFFISDRCSLCGDQCAKSVCGKCAR